MSQDLNGMFRILGEAGQETIPLVKGLMAILDALNRTSIAKARRSDDFSLLGGAYTLGCPGKERSDNGCAHLSSLILRISVDLPSMTSMALSLMT
jgi:hypothetical protein